MKSNFREDLKEAQVKENEFIASLERQGMIVTSTQDLGKFSGYDLTVKACEACRLNTVEVKYDKMSNSTGNVAVELYKTVSGAIQPSGLSATQANRIVYIFPDDPTYYIIDTHILKSFVDNKLYKRTVNGGDGNRVTLALFDKEWFKSKCWQLNEDFPTTGTSN